MSIQASKRHLALIAILTMAFGMLMVSASQAAVKSSGGAVYQVSWTPPSDDSSGGCGTDGDPDNPTVDHPQSRGNAISDGVELVDQPRLGGGAALWWSRLLQLVGIR